MAWHRQQSFAGTADAPALARAFLQRELRGLLGPDLDRAPEEGALVVSELVTNSVRAGTREVEVALSVTSTHLEVRVCDDGGGWPQQRQAGTADVTGRGLLLVSAIATEWGAEPQPRGKVVWARIALDGDERAAFASARIG